MKDVEYDTGIWIKNDDGKRLAGPFNTVEERDRMIDYLTNIQESVSDDKNTDNFGFFHGGGSLLST
jgi:hypothetical protein